MGIRPGSPFGYGILTVLTRKFIFNVYVCAPAHLTTDVRSCTCTGGNKIAQLTCVVAVARCHNINWYFHVWHYTQLVYITLVRDPEERLTYVKASVPILMET